MMLRARVELAWRTQAGHRHHIEGLENEDAVFVTDEHPLFDAVLMVADGMGGHPRPREASHAAVRAARAVLWDRAQLTAMGSIPDALDAALVAAHQAVQALADGARPAKAPGTTLSLAVLADGGLHVAHVGDGSVLLMRSGQVTALAGGEDRRAGNRPEQYLGQEPPLDPERRQLPVAEGDRVLLCTDGLTRYFREAGEEALERVLGREGVAVGAIAGQLTAHSRSTAYDDDTTVAILEVHELAHVPRPEPPPEERPVPEKRMPTTWAPPESVAQEIRRPEGTRRSPSPVSWLIAGALAGAALAAGGFAVGRFTAPAEVGPAELPTQSAPTGALRNLPPGNLVLVDRLGSRVYLLPTGGGRPGTEPVDLEARRVGPDGRLVEAGRFRLDPAAGTLTTPDGKQVPVDRTFPEGTIRVLRPGTLSVASDPPGAEVYIDARRFGPAPQRANLPGGRYRVRVRGRGWSAESAVELPAGGSLSITLARP